SNMVGVKYNNQIYSIIKYYDDDDNDSNSDDDNNNKDTITYSNNSNNNDSNITLTDIKYNFNTPTTVYNLYKILRSLSLNTPILLSGEPGIGKTSIIENIGRLLNYNVVRINLSEGTEFSDLIGHYIPYVDNNNTDNKNKDTNDRGKDTNIKIKFTYSSFTRALLQPYTFIILDEINLCTQSVIEGLNSLFDYRRSIYISELDQTIKINHYKNNNT
ncbi:AAA domain dynein-related subfamily protein, partial [Spraguea lophii 42_110]